MTITSATLPEISGRQPTTSTITLGESPAASSVATTLDKSAESSILTLAASFPPAGAITPPAPPPAESFAPAPLPVGAPRPPAPPPPESFDSMPPRDAQKSAVVGSNGNTSSEIDDLLKPLLNYLNDNLRDGWEEEFTICRDSEFNRLNDPNFIMIEMPWILKDHPNMVRGLTNLMSLSQCGLTGMDSDDDEEVDFDEWPFHFSIARKVYFDPGMVGYTNGVHLVLERTDPDTKRAKEQIRRLVRELKSGHVFTTSEIADDWPM